MKRLAPLALLPVLVTAACDTPSPTQDSLREPLATAVATDNTTFGDPQVTPSPVFPSTNEANFANGWAHVLWEPMPTVPIGEVTLNFVQPRGFVACFEYRIDDEAPIAPDNFNSDITDGLWSYTCPGGRDGNSSTQMTFEAASHVDVRMVFGGETDERFNWTRYYVLSLDNKDQCKNGEWEAMGFKNQGQCVRFVETGKDSRNGS